MRLRVLLQCAWRDLRAAPRRLFLSLTGIGLGLAALLLVSALSLALEQTIDKEFNRSAEFRRLEVRKQSLDLGFIKFDTSRLFGGQSGLSPDVVEDLEALEGIESVYPRLSVGLPMGARGGKAILGRSLYADLLLEGLPAELLSPTEPSIPWTEQDPVPIWVSERLVEIFNTTVATSLQLPQISPGLLQGFTFELVVGRSLLARSLEAKTQGTLKAKIVGTHPDVSTLGAATTLDIASRLQRSWAAEPPPLTFTTLLIDISTTRQLPEIVSTLESMGLEVDQSAQELQEMLGALKMFGFILSGLFLCLASLVVTQSFGASLLERRRDLSLYQGLGFSRRELMMMIGIQGFLLGLVGATLGCLTALGVGEGAEWFLTTILPDFPFKPSQWFIWSASSTLFTGFLGITLTVLAGLLPLRKLIDERSMLEDLH